MFDLPNLDLNLLLSDVSEGLFLDENKITWKYGTKCEIHFNSVWNESNCMQSSHQHEMRASTKVGWTYV